MKILKIIQIFFFIFLLNTGCEKKEQKVQIGGNFELTNHLGERTTNKSFDKKFMLVFFGFTNCPDFCPNTLNKISMIIDELSNQEKNNLAPLFITVDPERDNVEVLNKYLKNFHPKIVGLTGTVSQIDLVKKNYKIYSKKVMDMKHAESEHNNHSHGGYAIDHTTIMYFMDKKGSYLKHFNPETKSEEIITIIKDYL